MGTIKNRAVTCDIQLPVLHRANQVAIREMPGTMHPVARTAFGDRPGAEMARDLFTDVRKPPIRSTPIATFEKCPRKFLYQDKLGLVLKGEYADGLHRGIVFHKVQQALFTGLTQEEALASVATDFRKLCTLAMSEASISGYMPDGTSVEDRLVEMETNYNKARAMSIAFMTFKPFDMSKWEVLTTPEGTLCVELLLETKIPGIPVPIVAPCDLALRKIGTNEVWIVDYKTTSTNAKAKAQALRISAQIKLYRLVLQSHLNDWAKINDYPELTVAGSIHSVVQTTTIKFCRKDPTFDDYIKRVHTWYQEKHDADPDNSPMQQLETYFDEPVLGRELYLRLQQQSRASCSDPCLDRFYKAGDYACTDFFRVCQFADLCASSLAAWPDIVARRFKIAHREDQNE